MKPRWAMACGREREGLRREGMAEAHFAAVFDVTVPVSLSSQKVDDGFDGGGYGEDGVVGADGVFGYTYVLGRRCCGGKDASRAVSPQEPSSSSSSMSIIFFSIGFDEDMQRKEIKQEENKGGLLVSFVIGVLRRKRRKRRRGGDFVRLVVVTQASSIGRI